MYHYIPGIVLKSFASTTSVDSPVTVNVNEKRRNQPNAPLELPYFCLSVATRLTLCSLIPLPTGKDPRFVLIFLAMNPENWRLLEQLDDVPRSADFFDFLIFFISVVLYYVQYCACSL
jgi:hypothetical protein